MSNYRIEQASPTDASQLTHISHASKRHWQYHDDLIALWKETLTVTPAYIQNNNVYKLCTDDDTIAGFSAVEQRAAFLEITHLWLLPSYIGKGLGKKLLLVTLEKTASSGTLIRVESDPHAERFYRAQGFTTIGIVESIPEGRFLPLMERYWQ